MKIGIDARNLSSPTTGVARYLVNLLNEFSAMDTDHTLVLFTRKHIQKGVLPPGLDSVRIAGPNWSWKHIQAPFKLFTEKYDLFFVPTYSSPIIKSKPTVVTIHDLIFVRHPEWASTVQRLRFKTIVRLSAELADRIIAVSDSSRKEILALTGVDPKRVDLIYPGVGLPFRTLTLEEMSGFRPVCGKGIPYILYTGSIHPRRNIYRLLSVFSDIKRKSHSKYKLVIVGIMMQKENKLSQLLLRDGLQNEVFFTGYISDDELVKYYNAAQVFIYPSLYEGFGLPVLEAMACGTPVITSNVSSLPEVAGDAALQIDPTDESSIYRGLSRVLESKDLRQELRERGFQRCERFSWRHTAVKTLRLFESL